VKRILLAALALAAAGCASRARYTVPATAPSPVYKENANWKQAAPADATLRGNWWEMFGDAQLNALEDEVTVSNETLKAVDAQFAQSRALLRGSRSALYPQVGASPSVVGTQPSGNRAISAFHDQYADLVLPGSVSYEADVWGRIHSAVEASRGLAQASAADLEAARLSVHAELAVDYFSLRGLDREQDLLNTTVTAYERAVELTNNRFNGGIASQSDVAFAETQLETTRAQAIDVGVQRATLEHAIAVLAGQPASTFSIAASPLAAEPPVIPAGLPSDLLERRPDVAGAERRVAAANAQVGAATAAYYPLLMLTGSAGFESSSFGNWLASASNFWSAGPAALATVFDAGRRHAAADQARAAYVQAAAVYRGSVLNAFREVEDQLAALRLLDEESTVEARAVDAAERSLTLATNRYQGGVVTYLEVITAQSAALTNERAAVNLLMRRMSASVLLLKALGGGWDQATLPQLTASRAPSPSGASR
jgi:NodT family efflux transporter outer membrane factor (OMF) lipoprotein